MGSISGRKALHVCKNLEKILAIELLCAAQAFDFRKPIRSSDTLEAIHVHIRKRISHATEDRIFSEDILDAVDLIKSRELLEIANDTMLVNEEFQLFEVY
jgi:histidine ammonia-lyase